MIRPLNVAMGWIVASWLVAAAVSTTPAGGDYAFYACMGGAVLTVCIWCVLCIAILKAKAQGEGG